MTIISFIWSRAPCYFCWDLISNQMSGVPKPLLECTLSFHVQCPLQQKHWLPFRKLTSTVFITDLCPILLIISSIYGILKLKQEYIFYFFFLIDNKCLDKLTWKFLARGVKNTPISKLLIFQNFIELILFSCAGTTGALTSQ